MPDHVDIMTEREARELARLLHARDIPSARPCDLAGGSWSVLVPTSTATELHAVALPAFYVDDIVRVMVLPMDEDGEIDNVETAELVCATLDEGATALAGMLSVWSALVGNGAVLGIPRA